MSSYRVWVDVPSGTWGDPDDLFIVDVPGDQYKHWIAGNVTDQDVTNYASEHGTWWGYVTLDADQEAEDHRYNPAPFCAKCGGPCQMKSHDQQEDQAEVERHHRDFGRIDGILDAALKFGTLDHETALKQIRNIVG